VYSLFITKHDLFFGYYPNVTMKLLV